MANLSVGNVYVLSIVPEIVQKTHNCIGCIVVLNVDNFVNTEVGLHKDIV